MAERAEAWRFESKLFEGRGARLICLLDWRQGEHVEKQLAWLWAKMLGTGAEHIIVSWTAATMYDRRMVHMEKRRVGIMVKGAYERAEQANSQKRIRRLDIQMDEPEVQDRQGAGRGEAFTGWSGGPIHLKVIPWDMRGRADGKWVAEGPGHDIMLADHVGRGDVEQKTSLGGKASSAIYAEMTEFPREASSTLWQENVNPAELDLSRTWRQECDRKDGQGKVRAIPAICEVAARMAWRKRHAPQVQETIVATLMDEMTTDARDVLLEFVLNEAHCLRLAPLAAGRLEGPLGKGPHSTQ